MVVVDQMGHDCLELKSVVLRKLVGQEFFVEVVRKGMPIDIIGYIVIVIFGTVAHNGHELHFKSLIRQGGNVFILVLPV